MKSVHDYINKQIPYEEITNFVEPVKVNINIPIYDFINFSKGDSLEELQNGIRRINAFVMSNASLLGGRISNSITYNTHMKGYDFRINPIDVVNNLFIALGFDYKIPFINLDAIDGIEYFKQYVLTCTSEIKKICLDERKLMVIDDLEKRLDNIISFYNVDINKEMEKNIIPKDFIFYIAYRNLRLYEETKDEKYLVFPYEYYHHVSHMNTSEFPHSINIDGEKLRHYDFRLEYKKLVKPDYVPDVKKYIVRDSDIIIGLDILKPGEASNVIKDAMQRTRAASNVDYEKYKKLYEMKANYYMSSPYYNFIKGTFGLKGYIGFSYENEYLIFDKLFNSDAKKSILTHGEAIFTFPSDRFDIACNDKQYALREKKTDDRIGKINHTETGSFIKKLDKVIESENVSTSTLREEVKKYKTKILIRN